MDQIGIIVFLEKKRIMLSADRKSQMFPSSLAEAITDFLSRVKP